MDTKAIKESLFFYNPWWESNEVPKDLVKEYQRPVIKKLLSYLLLERIIILKGPRRTGKTTLLYQIIEYLLKNGTASSDILFLSLDDMKLRIDLDEIFSAYQEINRRLIKEGRTIYVFLDEVHFLENWQFYVKKYFDRKYPVKFIVSGSAATLIKKGTESLAGRTVEETIYPFSFYEFLAYRLKNQKLLSAINNMCDNLFPFYPVDTTDIIPYMTEIKIAFEEYSERGGFPNLFDVKEKIIWSRLIKEDIIEKVIYRDLVELYGIKKPEILEKLFLYLADISSQILSVSNIANSIGLSREYTEKYLLYLEQSLLIKRLNKYAKSVEKSIRSAGKIHFIDPGLINAFAAHIGTGEVLESMVASHLIRCEEGNLYYFREHYEIDLVFDIDGEIFPIEVKSTDRISKRDLRGLYSFGKKFERDTLIMVTPNRLKEESSDGFRIIYLPAWLLMLLTGEDWRLPDIDYLRP